MEMNEVYNEGAQNPPATPKRPTLHKECQRYLDSIPDIVKTVKENSKRFEFLDALQAEFKDCYWYSNTYAPLKDWEVKFNFETFAQAKRVLRRMAEAGIKREGKVTQSAEYGTMTWRYKHWTIIGHFKSEKGNACRYVQVGTKTVEQPIYELKCAEAFDPQFAPAIKEVDGDGLPF